MKPLALKKPGCFILLQNIGSYKTAANLRHFNVFNCMIVLRSEASIICFFLTFLSTKPSRRFRVQIIFSHGTERQKFFTFRLALKAVHVVSKRSNRQHWLHWLIESLFALFLIQFQLLASQFSAHLFPCTHGKHVS